MQILAANLALASKSANPCAEAIDDYCSDETGAARHYCLARKRDRIDYSCAERVKAYFSEHPEESMPESEGQEAKDLETKGILSLGSDSRSGISWWPDPSGRKKASNDRPSKGIATNEAAPSAFSPPSNVPTGENIYDPYSNLRNLIQEYHSESNPY